MTSPRDPQAVVAAIAAAEDDHGRHVNAVVRQYFDDDRPTDRADRLLTIAADYRGELEVARARIAELEAAAARVAQLEERIGVLEQRPGLTLQHLAKALRKYKGTWPWTHPGIADDATILETARNLLAAVGDGPVAPAESQPDLSELVGGMQARIADQAQKLKATHKKLRRLEARPALTHKDLGQAIVAADLDATEYQCKQMLEWLRSSVGPARIDAMYHPAPDVFEVDLEELRKAYAVGWTRSQHDLPRKDVDTYEPESWRAVICHLAETYPDARVSQLRVTPRAPKEG